MDPKRGHLSIRQDYNRIGNYTFSARETLGITPDTNDRGASAGDIKPDPVGLEINRFAAHPMSSIEETPHYVPALTSLESAAQYSCHEQSGLETPKTWDLPERIDAWEHVSGLEPPWPGFVHSSGSETMIAYLEPSSDTVCRLPEMPKIKSPESISMRTYGSHNNDLRGSVLDPPRITLDRKFQNGKASHNRLSFCSFPHTTSNTASTAPLSGMGVPQSKSKSEWYPTYERPRQAWSCEAKSDDEEDTSSEGSNASSKLIPHTRRGARDTPVFACPFWKMDPIRHMDCLTRRLTRIRDVKQHLQRKHYQGTFRCPICWKQFTILTDRDEHARLQSCKKLSLPRTGQHDFVSQEAQRLLKHRISRSATPEKQWYAVWDILFLHKPRPSSPYLGAMLEEASGMIRGFWQRECTEIVRRVLETRPEHAACDRTGLNHLLLKLIDEIQLSFDQELHQAISAKRAPSNSNNHIELTATHCEGLELGVAPIDITPLPLSRGGRYDTQMQPNDGKFLLKSPAYGLDHLAGSDEVGEASGFNHWDVNSANPPDYITAPYLNTNSYDERSRISPSSVIEYSIVDMLCSRRDFPWSLDDSGANIYSSR